MVKKTDVVIIGGGIIGCAAAYYVAKLGAKVVLLEKGELGGEGTGRTFGLVRDIGRVPAEIPIAVESLSLWKGLPTELDYDIGWVQGGGLEIAETEQALEKFAKYASAVRGSGMECRVISAEEVRRIIPTEVELVGGIYSKKSGHAEPLAVIQGFTNAARKLGVQIYTWTPCWDVEVSRGRVSAVVTNRGKIRTKAVVNAAGAYAPRIAEKVGFHMPIKVVSVMVAETEPVQPMLKTWVLGPRSTIRQTIGGTLYTCNGLRIITEHYVDFYDFQDMKMWLSRFSEFRELLHLRFDANHLWREFRRVFGVSWETRRKAEFPIFQPKPNNKIADGYIKELKRMLPSIGGTKLQRVWAGLLDLTPDMLPVIGELDNPKGFIIAAGLSGHGFALGPRIGQLISEIAVNRRASLPLEAFRPYRFAEGKFTKPAEYYST